MTVNTTKIQLEDNIMNNYMQQIGHSEKNGQIPSFIDEFYHPFKEEVIGILLELLQN